MKGQNLRLTLGGKCVAASKTLNFHVAANVEDISSKDSSGDWAENECTGKSWDASVDAMVIGRVEEVILHKEWNSPTDFSTIKGYYHYPSVGINVPKGATVRCWCDSESLQELLYYGWLISISGDNVVTRWASDASWTKPYMEWYNNTSSSVVVYPAYAGMTSVVNGPIYASVYMDDDAKILSDFEAAIINETEFTARFIATDPDSAKNRVEDECYAEGTCVITDISVNAQSRQTATYSVKLQGIGALDFDPE